MADPITREQVERAIAKPRCIDYRELPRGWREWAPDYVIAAEADDDWDADDWDAEHAALTRWRDELAAAEPVRRVARWSEADDLYRLDPPHEYSMAGGESRAYLVARVQAIAWGYEIEGGPEPIDDSTDQLPARCGDCEHYDGDRLCRASSGRRFTWGSYEPASWCPLRRSPEPIDDSSPERLRERREALGWTTAYAGHWVPWFNHTDVERAECGRGVPAFVARYAAALSAAEAEAERAASKPHMTPSFRRDIAVMRATGASLSAIADKYLLSLSEVSEAIGPEAQPAPEVVDVPQPRIVVKRCDEVEAEWTSADATILIVTHDALDDAIFVPIALLRAMLEAIDAQQGGAS